MDIKKTTVLALGLDLIIGLFFALSCALAFHLILFMSFWAGLLIGFFLYAAFRVLSWLGERGDVDI